jgi:TetR/AcrR family transcriptional regulator
MKKKRPGPVGRRARQRSELPGDTKELILTVAEELFAQKGFAGVRTHEIAERAGVNKAMIYYWFQSKEQLLRAVLQRVLFDLITLSQEIFARKLDTARLLEQFYRGFFYYAARHRNFSRLTTMDLGSEGGYLRTMFESFFRPLFDRGVAFIERAVERGELKAVNARQLLVTIYGMTIAYFADANQVALLYGVSDALDDRLLEERLEANLDFIFAAVGSPRPSKSGS